MSESKMKKVMLVAGMATALNLGMGLENGGWAMINEEENEGQVSCLRTIVFKNANLSLDALNEKLEFLDSLGQLSPLYDDEYLNNLLVDTSSALASAGGFMTTYEIMQYNNFIELIKNNMNLINKKHFQYLGENLESIKRDTCY